MAEEYRRTEIGWMEGCVTKRSLVTRVPDEEIELPLPLAALET
jgi:hypothetical protein